jgi:transcriptional regulator
MYIPKLFEETNNAEILAFMQEFSFATIITSENNTPVASHLPFTITKRGDEIILTSHFARANPQWETISKNRILVIFNEPHAYISPSHYDKVLSVPTWNYISVHAYGEGRIIDTSSEAISVLETMIDTYDPEYKKQWNTLPEDFKIKMVNGIVAFEITVTGLQASKKLSQNKSDIEQQRIIETLSGSKNTTENKVADYMKRNQGSKDS